MSMLELVEMLTGKTFTLGDEASDAFDQAKTGTQDKAGIPPDHVGPSGTSDNAKALFHGLNGIPPTLQQATLADPADCEALGLPAGSSVQGIADALGIDATAARAFLTRFDEDYARFNATYEMYFAPGRLPARTCIGVTALATGARVEVDLIARRTP